MINIALFALKSLLFTMFIELSQWAHYGKLLKSHTSIFFVIAYTFIFLSYVPYQ
jgi:hypothetical protein